MKSNGVIAEMPAISRCGNHPPFCIRAYQWTTLPYFLQSSNNIDLDGNSACISNLPWFSAELTLIFTRYCVVLEMEH